MIHKVFKKTFVMIMRGLFVIVLAGIFAAELVQVKSTNRDSAGISFDLVLNVIIHGASAQVQLPRYNGNIGGGAGGGVFCPIPSLPQLDAVGLPIDPNAKKMSDDHDNANGNKADPAYGGDCTPSDFDNYMQKQHTECDLAKGKACNDTTPKRQAKANADQFTKCAKARENVMNACFRGGESGHRTQAYQNWVSAANCMAVFYKK